MVTCTALNYVADAVPELCIYFIYLLMIFSGWGRRDRNE